MHRARDYHSLPGTGKGNRHSAPSFLSCPRHRPLCPLLYELIRELLQMGNVFLYQTLLYNVKYVRNPEKYCNLDARKAQ
jgi:hypothetical protein